jgi:4-hydroxybenzoate polyprenyltransferase
LITAIAWMAHLLDRAKPLAAWNDPADRMANPRRDAFVQRYRLAMNFLTGSLGLSACILAMFIEPWLVVLVPAGAIAVVVYGSRPSDSRRPRPKDVLVLKNALTGLAYATLIGCALWAALPDRTGLWPALAIVALVVAADAILSDIDDRPADEAFGTRTVPVLAGRRRATLAAAGIYGAAMAIWAIWGTPNAAAGFVAIGLPLTGLALAVLPRTRTAIDLRAGAVALLAILL